MNAQRTDRLLLCIAIAMGLGISTGHPLGIVAAAGMPLVCLGPGTRKAAFRATLGYYAAALWPIAPGIERYLGPRNTLLAVMLWALAAMLLSTPWTIAWTSKRMQYVWRAPAALLATVVPPLGIIGLASPLTGAGYLFPGTGWIGLAAVALLPGILLSTLSFSLRARGIVVGLAVGLCIASRIYYSGDTDPPRGWIAINTHFGDVSQPFRDFAAAQFIQERANESSARVLIFPEAVVPRWSEATEAFWHRTLDRCRSRGQILAIGAGLPARPTRNDRRRLGDLRSYDFRETLGALTGVDTPPIHEPLSSPRPEPIDNTMILVGAQSATFYQRVPVAVGMWRPFGSSSVPLRLGAPGTLTIDHQRAAVLICYEQLLTFPILTSMLEHPTVIVGISNVYWVDSNNIPQYQATALRVWSQLFHLPYLMTVNS
jgi:hypothetical protein